MDEHHGKGYLLIFPRGTSESSPESESVALDPAKFLPKGISPDDVYSGLKRGFYLTGGGTVVYGFRIRATEEESRRVKNELGLTHTEGVDFQETPRGEGYLQIAGSGFTASTPESQVIERVNGMGERILRLIGRENR